MSSLMRMGLGDGRAAPPAAGTYLDRESRFADRSAASAELAADDVLAAHVAGLLVAEIERARHGRTHAVRRRPGDSPAVGIRHDLLPVVGTLGDVRGVIELVELGGVFGDEAVRLDEIGEYVAARSVAADPPLDVEPVLLEATGAAHQPVDVRQLVGHVIERGPVIAEDRHAVV